MTTKKFSKALHALLPQIRERREEIEEARRLPKDLVDDLCATGVFTLGAPKSLGGQESNPLDLMQVIETVCTADGSTGWCTMLGVGSGFVSAFADDRGAKEIFADIERPKALMAEPAGRAARTKGGVRVTGRWRFASGITHSDWVCAGCMIVKDGAPVMTEQGPEIVHLWMPVSDVEIHDTWYTAGMRGTGSFDFSVEDLFVPEDRIFGLFQRRERPEAPYRMPILSIVAPQIAVTSLGIARAALDELTELSTTKRPAMSMATLADKPVTQVQLAQAEAALGAARSYLYEAVDDVWQTVLAGDEPTLRQRGLSRAAAVHAATTAAAVAQTASALAGSTTVYNASSLQRHARDAETVTHHQMVSPQTWEDAGRVLVGLNHLAPLF